MTRDNDCHATRSYPYHRPHWARDCLASRIQGTIPATTCCSAYSPRLSRRRAMPVKDTPVSGSSSQSTPRGKRLAQGSVAQPAVKRTGSMFACTPVRLFSGMLASARGCRSAGRFAVIVCRMKQTSSCCLTLTPAIHISKSRQRVIFYLSICYRRLCHEHSPQGEATSS